MARAFAEFLQIETPAGIMARRRDTRFYFGEQEDTMARSHGMCVGVVYLQNPGAATSQTPKRKRNGRVQQTWGPLNYADENLMPHLQRVMEDTLERMRKSPNGKRKAARLVKYAYIQILNLSYLREPKDDTGETIKLWRKLVRNGSVKDDIPSPQHSKQVRFVLFGWGSKFRVEGDELRVASVLGTFSTDKTVFFSPICKDIEEGKPLIGVRMDKTGVLPKLPRKAAYPIPLFGTQTFLDNYVRIVSTAIVEVL